MYRLILESLLGVRRSAGTLRIAPCLPAAWTSFEVRYRYGRSEHAITVVQADRDEDAAGVWFDGEPQEGGDVTLVDDGAPHAVRVVLRARPTA
jgi:cellobiose phosphorylase